MYKGKNDHRLILTDFGPPGEKVPSRLRLMKGLTTVSDFVLLEPPAGIVTFSSDPVLKRNVD